MNDDKIEILDDFDDLFGDTNQSTENDNVVNDFSSNLTSDDVNQTTESNEQVTFDEHTDLLDNSNDNGNNINEPTKVDNELDNNSNTQNNNIIKENKENKEEIENPIVEMVNNKTTMKLIIIMLVVLFLAVVAMPFVIDFIKNI